MADLLMADGSKDDEEAVMEEEIILKAFKAYNLLLPLHVNTSNIDYTGVVARSAYHPQTSGS